MDKITIKAECTVDVKDGESLNQACLRSINEAIADVSDKLYPTVVYLSEYHFYETPAQPEVGR